MELVYQHGHSVAAPPCTWLFEIAKYTQDAYAAGFSVLLVAVLETCYSCHCGSGGGGNR